MVPRRSPRARGVDADAAVSETSWVVPRKRRGSRRAGTIGIGSAFAAPSSAVLTVLLLAFASVDVAHSFIPQAGYDARGRRVLQSAEGADTAVAPAASAAATAPALPELDGDALRQQLERARSLLERAGEDDGPVGGAAAAGANGAAAAATDDDDEDAAAPPSFFFASVAPAPVPDKRRRVVTSVDAAGCIRTDGAAMAALSEAEPWAPRGLGDVFANEAAESSMAGRALNERDLAKNVAFLRRQLQDTDFTAIFDERNRFIGELD